MPQSLRSQDAAHTEADTAGSAESISRGLSDRLASVVDATDNWPARITEAEMEALLAVARSLPDECDVREVAGDLVAALLRTNYQRLNLSERAFEAIATRISETLCETPAALSRTQSLWDQLRGVAT